MITLTIDNTGIHTVFGKTQLFSDVRELESLEITPESIVLKFTALTYTSTARAMVKVSQRLDVLRRAPLDGINQ